MYKGEPGASLGRNASSRDTRMEDSEHSQLKVPFFKEGTELARFLGERNNGMHKVQSEIHGQPCDKERPEILAADKL